MQKSLILARKDGIQFDVDLKPAPYSVPEFYTFEVGIYQDGELLGVYCVGPAIGEPGFDHDRIDVHPESVDAVVVPLLDRVTAELQDLSDYLSQAFDHRANISGFNGEREAVEKALLGLDYLKLEDGIMIKRYSPQESSLN